MASRPCSRWRRTGSLVAFGLAPPAGARGSSGMSSSCGKGRRKDEVEKVRWTEKKGGRRGERGRDERSAACPRGSTVRKRTTVSRELSKQKLESETYPHLGLVGSFQAVDVWIARKGRCVSRTSSRVSSLKRDAMTGLTLPVDVLEPRMFLRQRRMSLISPHVRVPERDGSTHLDLIRSVVRERRSLLWVEEPTPPLLEDV